MIKIFQNCNRAAVWDRFPPTTEEVFMPEYIKHRGWEGTLVWINPMADNHWGDWEENPFAEQTTTLRMWQEHYVQVYIEEAISCWCREFCVGRWDKFKKYGVEFEKEEDAVLFKFQWAL